MEKENTNLTHIGIFDDVIPPEKCQEIIEQFKLNKDRHYSGQTSGGDWDGKITTDWNIDPNLDKDTDTLIYETFSNCFKKYIEKFNISHASLPYTICDSGYKVMEYIKGTGKFDEHIDNSFHKSTRHRFLTALLYLNTIEEGGETEFPSQGITVKTKVGRVVMFPPFFTHPHKGHIPLSENKYVINGFFMRGN